MTPSGGGLTVGLVGSDGSGKSTVTAEVATWLGWKVDTRVVYLGSKSPSRRSRWSYTVFRALRRSGRVPWLRDVVRATHEVAIAGDRARRAAEGRAAASRGSVVFFDRYPMTALSDATEHQVLDGPRIGRVVPADGRVVRRLGRIERRRYEGLGLPDVLVFLLVSPEVAAGRKPDHRPEVLAAKTTAAEELAALAELPGATKRSLRVDATRPLDEVLLTVEGGVFDAL
jgi:thymidylate kinase